jgi:UDP-2,3-diacylglucosamine pyrophosphatase LpxH
MRRIAFISCTHVGSVCAPWPEFTRPDGVVISPSPAQQQLNEYFADFWTHEAKDADTIALIGDMCQGNNRKEFGRNCTAVELEMQVDACIQLLQPHIQGRKVIGVSGSGYHSSLDTSLDRSVIKGLGGEFLGALFVGDLGGTGKKMLVTHGGASPTMYKGSFEDRESMLMDAAIGSKQIAHDIDLIVKGHWHYFSVMKMEHRTLVRVPGWQCWYPAKFMVDNYGKRQNKLGGVVIDIGEERIDVYERLYDKPQIFDAPVSV